MAKCRGCGREIVFCGKIPCDPALRAYWKREGAKGKIVTNNGEVLSCVFSGAEGAATGVGRLPHWATCPKAGEFRKKKC